VHFRTTNLSEFIKVPALAVRVIDRVGAGDALLALSSLLVKQDAPWEIVGLVGNAAGAEVVAEIGNRISVNKIDLSKHLISILR